MLSNSFELKYKTVKFATEKFKFMCSFDFSDAQRMCTIGMLSTFIPIREEILFHILLSWAREININMNQILNYCARFGASSNYCSMFTN